jgi:hypothetical protein
MNGRSTLPKDCGSEHSAEKCTDCCVIVRPQGVCLREKYQDREKGTGNLVDTSYAARILRERRVSELEFEALTYSTAPPLAIPELACEGHMKTRYIVEPTRRSTKPCCAQ